MILVTIIPYPLLSFAPLPPLVSVLVVVVYDAVASLFLVGILAPVAVYWFMGRPRVKAYFEVSESAGEAQTVTKRHIPLKNIDKQQLPARVS